MDYLIVGVIAIVALLYIIRHVRSMLKGNEAGSSCDGCGCSCGVAAIPKKHAVKRL